MFFLYHRSIVGLFLNINMFFAIFFLYEQYFFFVCQ